MSILSDHDRERVREMLADLPGEVRLVFFTQSIGCETCFDTKRVLDEIASLAPKVRVEEHNLVLDKAPAALYGVDRAPTVAVVGERDYGIRFVGAPVGYEFASLIDAIQLVAAKESGLSDESRALAAAVDHDTTIQVFVTPT